MGRNGIGLAVRSLAAVVHRMGTFRPIESKSCDCHEENQCNNFSEQSVSHTFGHNFH